MSKFIFRYGLLLVAALGFLALFFCVQARADNIYTCNVTTASKYADCGDANIIIKGTIQPSDLVATTTGNSANCAVGPESFWYCPAFQWQSASTLNDSSQIGFCGGTDTTLSGCAHGNGGLSGIALKSALQGVTWAQTIPASTTFVCLPKLSWPLKAAYGELPTGVSTRADHYAVWVCETPTGYWVLGHLIPLTQVASNIFSYIEGKLGLTDANALCATNCWTTLTQSESDFLNAQENLIQPVALVAFNSGKKTRTAYGIKADGTLDTSVSDTIAVASPCNWGKRISNSIYYSVSGQLNSSGQTLGDMYTICTISLPIGSN